MSYTFTLPLPPSVNAAYSSFVRKGQSKITRCKSPAYLKWEREADNAFYPIGIEAMGDLEVCYRFYFTPTQNRKTDIANYEKCLTDFLVKHHAMGDDRQICRMILERMPPDKENPRVEGEIRSV